MTIQDTPIKPGTADKTASAGPNDVVKKHEYEFHPIANIFPLMEGQEFKALVDDIKANGLREPVVIYEGKVIDGRNRYKACKELNLPTPTTKPYDGGDPLGFVLSANLHRRHLNESQRAVVAAKLVTTKLGDNQHTSKNRVGQLTKPPQQKC
jgi:ParB-like nuclease domain